MNIINFLREIEHHLIIGIVGDLGDGKSISGISLVILLDKLYQLTGEKKTILTNVPLESDHKFLQYYSQMDDMHNTLLFIDELHQIADSRKSMSKTNFLTMGVTMDIRKFNNKFIYTTQETSQVEKRIRNRTVLFLHPRQVGTLVFEIALTNVIGHEYDEVIINLNGFKDLYDTHYKPIPLMMDED